MPGPVKCVGVLRGPHSIHCQPLRGSTEAGTTLPGPRPGAKATSKCTEECHSSPVGPTASPVYSPNWLVVLVKVLLYSPGGPQML